MQRTHMCRRVDSMHLWCCELRKKTTSVKSVGRTCVSLAGRRFGVANTAWNIEAASTTPHAARCVCRFTPLYAFFKSREVVGGAESKKTKVVLSFTCTRTSPMKANPDILLKQPYLLDRRHGPASSSGRQRTAGQTPLCPAPPLRLMIAAAVAAASAVASRKHL